MNSNLLRASIAKNGYTQQRLAEEMNISNSSFTRKMKNGTFSLKESEWLIRKLGIKKSESIQIFLPCG